MTLTAPPTTTTTPKGLGQPPFAAARNPYALAEAILGRPVDWSEITDRRAFLEEVLQTPYEELFDPKHGSPVYFGYERDGKGGLKEVRPKLAAADEAPSISDVERFPGRSSGRRRLADLGQLIGAHDLENVPVRSIAPSRAGGYVIEVGESPSRRLETLARLFPTDTVAKLINIYELLDMGWTPPNGSWVDTGTFFDEAAEFFDPIQGFLGDCWLIAAMSSVAWALPYTVSQRSRATGAGNEQFTNLFRFVDPATGTPVQYEATDATIVWTGTTSPMYGHSSEAGEIWPALVEKAYAMWRAGTTNDRPNLTVLNGGDPVHASAALTGRTPHYTGTSGTSAANLLQLVQANSTNYRTVNPMTAWTYNSADDAPDEIDYDDANIAACHAYSVLGWVKGSSLTRYLKDTDISDAWRTARKGFGAEVADGSSMVSDRLVQVDLYPWKLFEQDYILLRNPWGYHEATLGNLGGTIPVRDVSFWRSINLDEVDGVFAITPATFKKYFAGIGVAL
ncbi:MAG TPA: C2 family cysteine protease [Acidimicrobiales bacterium]